MSEGGPSVGAAAKRRISLETTDYGADVAESPEKRHRSKDVLEVDVDLHNEIHASDDSEDDADESLPPPSNMEADQEYPYFKRIHLENFMCHQKFTMLLNPRMNFVHGKNGSGKSAVLIALSVGLGSSSKDTKRADSLKEYVGSFGSSATIAITIHQGGERYPGKFPAGEFGEDIIVERTISKSGAAAYKLKKGDSKTVLSTKKEDLRSILQFLGFQPDNPIQIMQQSDSKTFLHVANSLKFYEFFARATKMKEYEEEIVQLFKTRNMLQIDLGRNKRMLDSYTAAEFNDAKQVFDSMQDACKLEDEIFQLYDECMWAIERDAEADVQANERERTILVDAVHKAQEKANKCLEDLEQCNGEGDHFTASIDQAKREHEEAKHGMKEAEAALRTATHDHKEAEDGAKVAEKLAKDLACKIQSLRNQIEEQRRAAEQRRAEKRRKSARPVCDIAELERNLDSYKEKEEQKRIEIKRLEQHDGDNTQASTQAENLLRHMKTKVEKADSEVKRLSNSASSSGLGRFGAEVDTVARELSRAAGFERRPIGPIGKYITMKDQRFADAISAALGWVGLKTFLVFGGQRDKQRCEQVLRGKTRNPRAFQCDFANTDRFSHAKLGSNGLPCLLDVIQVSDEFGEEEGRIVMNYLVDRCRFNEIRAVDSWEDVTRTINAEPEQVQLPNGVRHTVAGQAYYWNPAARTVDRIMKHKSLGAASSFLKSDKTPRGVFSEDQTEARENAKQNKEMALQEMRDAEGRFKAAKREQQQSQAATVQARRELKELTTQIEKRSKQVRKEKMKQREEEGEDAEEEVDNTELYEKEIDEVRTKLTAANDEKEEFVKEAAKRQERVNAAKEVKSDRATRLTEKAKAAQALAKNLDSFEERRESARVRKENADAKLEKKQQELQQTEAKLAQAKTEHDDILEQAQKQCDRIVTDQTKDQIQKKIEDNRRKIKSMEKNLGVSKDIAAQKWKDAKAKEKKMRDKIARMNGFEETISMGAKKRLKKFKTVLKFRKRNATWEFDKFINQRDFQGRLVFSEDGKKQKVMEPRVSTQKDSEGHWQEAKSVKELSGGERSYATLCMVLALSKVSAAPFLAMDEFDVFMDETNRTVGLKMLIHVLRAKRDCQTIVISPLSMAEVDQADDLWKIRMKDPDRNQSTLT